MAGQPCPREALQPPEAALMLWSLEKVWSLVPCRTKFNKSYHALEYICQSLLSSGFESNGQFQLNLTPEKSERLNTSTFHVAQPKKAAPTSCLLKRCERNSARDRHIPESMQEAHY